MEDEAMIRAMKSAFQEVSSAQWLKEVGNQTDLGSLSERNSSTGVFFRPSLVQADIEGTSYGGFFASISSENRDSAIDILFNQEGDWLKQYLDTGNRPGVVLSRDPQKEAFIEAYDKFMVGFLDPRRLGQNAFTQDSFINGTTRDQTVTDKEIRQIIEAHGFKPLLKNMGPELSKQWIQFAGGVVQGLIDYESRIDAVSFKRYEASEFTGLVSPDAKAEIEDNFNSTPYKVYARGDAFTAATSLMDDKCKTSIDHTFTPPKRTAGISK